MVVSSVDNHSEHKNSNCTVLCKGPFAVVANQGKTKDMKIFKEIILEYKNEMTTSVYCQPTNRAYNFHRSLQPTYKFGTAFTLPHRYLRICSILN